MQAVFQNQWIVVLYLVGCIALAWHLMHGFQSAFRTLGVSNKRYLSILNCLGIGFSIIVPLGLCINACEFLFRMGVV